MAFGTNIRTFFEGAWHDGNVPIMRAADHGSWLGTTVFDGARYVDGIAPDLDLHCARVNRSAEAMRIAPSVTTEEMVDLVWEGLRLYPAQTPLYIRPMYWSVESDYLAVLSQTGPTGFAICLEEVPVPPSDATTTLTTTQFHRPVLGDAICNAKAGCLYPNNARMLMEARSKGYGNALVADAMGNVAESATANVFMVRDGVVFTPIPNGTFLAGITRARHIRNLREDGVDVVECVLTFDDFRAADEVFLSGNLTKVTPVTEFDGTTYEVGPVAHRARQLYWDWAHSAP